MTVTRPGTSQDPSWIPIPMSLLWTLEWDAVQGAKCYTRRERERERDDDEGKEDGRVCVC